MTPTAEPTTGPTRWSDEAASAPIVEARPRLLCPRPSCPRPPFPRRPDPRLIRLRWCPRPPSRRPSRPRLRQPRCLRLQARSVGGAGSAEASSPAGAWVADGSAAGDTTGAAAAGDTAAGDTAAGDTAAGEIASGDPGPRRSARTPPRRSPGRLRRRLSGRVTVTSPPAACHKLRGLGVGGRCLWRLDVPCGAGHLTVTAAVHPGLRAAVGLGGWLPGRDGLAALAVPCPVLLPHEVELSWLLVRGSGTGRESACRVARSTASTASSSALRATAIRVVPSPRFISRTPFVCRPALRTSLALVRMTPPRGGDREQLVVDVDDERADQPATPAVVLDRQHALAAATLDGVLLDRGPLRVPAVGGDQHEHTLAARRPSTAARRPR